MGNDKFDFGVASLLVEMVDMGALTLEMKNEQIQELFQKLKESFRDEGYDGYSADMKSANNAANDVISQMKIVAKHIAQYAEKLKKI